MAYRMTFLSILTLLWIATSIGLAQAPKPAKKPAKKPAAEKATDVPQSPNPAKLRAEMHRAMATLIEAQQTPKPDQAKIDKLTKQIQNLRRQIWTQGPVGSPRAWQCPWGGPGMGYGRGWGGRGMGYGRGPGWGRGYGPGRGPGWAPGYGPARGPGWTPGYGPGYGNRCGPRWGYVDRDGDGVCDNFQRAQGQQK